MYYVFPCGMFDTKDYSGLYTIMRHRVTPSTPQGDRVADFATSKEAETEAAKLNSENLTLEQAMAKFANR